MPIPPPPVPLDDLERLPWLHAVGRWPADHAAGRPGHFMPASLVTSQFATLEALGPDEAGVVLDLDLSVDELVARVHAGITAADRGADPTTVAAGGASWRK
jgi:gluconokinase